jgi:hypothetical protein
MSSVKRDAPMQPSWLGMAYDYHIKRFGDGLDSGQAMISFTDWLATVAATEGVRLSAPQARAITNPKSGEIISIPTREGDAEVFFVDSGQWRPVFRWLDYSVVFAGRFDPRDASHPV